jgi:hypothetical protein
MDSMKLRRARHKGAISSTGSRGGVQKVIGSRPQREMSHDQGKFSLLDCFRDIFGGCAVVRHARSNRRRRGLVVKIIRMSPRKMAEIRLA